MIMETPELYAPSMTEQGRYIDRVPNIPPVGLRCPCTNRVYDKKSLFKIHTGSFVHITWLCNMNQNKQNYYTECNKLTDTVKQQQKLLTSKEVDIVKLTTHIVNLSLQVAELSREVNVLRSSASESLIDFGEEHE